MIYVEMVKVTMILLIISMHFFVLYSAGDLTGLSAELNPRQPVPIASPFFGGNSGLVLGNPYSVLDDTKSEESAHSENSYEETELALGYDSDDQHFADLGQRYVLLLW